MVAEGEALGVGLKRVVVVVWVLVVEEVMVARRVE
jgi:hypothetical protein